MLLRLVRSLLVLALLCGFALSTKGAPPIPYATVFTPGTPTEQTFLMKVSGTIVGPTQRSANRGEFWVYGFPVAAGARCRLGLTLEGADSAPPNVVAIGLKNLPLPTVVEKDTDGSYSALWTVPAKWPLGERLSVRISAKTGPITITLVRFVQVEPDSNGDGVPDSVLNLMRGMLPPDSNVLQTVHPPDRPATVTQTAQPPTPTTDLQTDALFAYTSDPAAIAAWKARGYTVWTMGGSRDNKEYASKHPDEVQTTLDGQPITVEGSYYLSPTTNRINVAEEYYRKALEAGSEGVCPEEPEYWARAGYETAFQEAWQQQFSSSWRDPMSSPEARWKSGQLMAALETNFVDSILLDTQMKRPAARRLVALHSPLNYAQWGIVSPQYRLTSLSSVQEVIGQVWSGTARAPIRYTGVRRENTFGLAYLEYSSLYQLMRGNGKRLWFLVDPVEDQAGLPLADYKTRYEQTVAAALMFPEVSAYEVMPWPERVYGKVPPDYAAQVTNIITAMGDIGQQKTVSGNAASADNIGVLVSDSMQWQRGEPNTSDLDGVFGLSLPLLQHGIPVQMVSLDRAIEPGYLRSFKTLLLSYDFQKPLDQRVHTALNNWVRAGGALIFAGGSDAYNNIADSWWRKAGLVTPQQDLWKQLSLNTGTSAVRTAAQEDKSAYRPLLSGDGSERNLRNRRPYEIDLTELSRQTGSIYMRFSDVSVQDGWGPSLFSLELRLNGQIVVSFAPGSEIENRFLAFDNNSQINALSRFADGNSSWPYRFDNLPRDAKVTLTVDIGNGFQISGASAAPDFGHALIAAPNTGTLGTAFPRLRISAGYPATLYPQIASTTASDAPSALYSLRAGGTAVWNQVVGKGLVMNVGVAPGFFSASERSAAFLRALVQYAHQRVGGTYKEPLSLRIQRGPYTILHTGKVPETVAGRTIDLFSSTLAVGSNRTVPANSQAVLYDLGPESAPPHIGFIAGRVQARAETTDTTLFFVRAPFGVPGAARLHSGNRNLAGVRAFDRLGRKIGVQAITEGSTVLLRYANNPDGVLLLVRWKNG